MTSTVSAVQGELDWVVGGVGCQGNQVQSSVEVQQLFEQLVSSLEELLSLGSQRLAQGPIAELRDRAQLQQQHSTHTVGLRSRDEVYISVVKNKKT